MPGYVVVPFVKLPSKKKIKSNNLVYLVYDREKKKIGVYFSNSYFQHVIATFINVKSSKQKYLAFHAAVATSS